MVGDRLDSDIVFGNNAGFTTLLVMSGVTSDKLLCKKKDEAGGDPTGLAWWPDHKLATLADLREDDDVSSPAACGESNKRPRGEGEVGCV